MSSISQTNASPPDMITVRDLQVSASQFNQWANLSQTVAWDKAISIFNVQPGVNVFSGGVAAVPLAGLQWQEVAAIMQAFSAGLKTIEKASPSIAQGFRQQLNLAFLFGSIAKAKFSSGNKPINFPSQPGTIGVNWLSPQFVKYIGTATATNPAYTDYTSDKWTLSLAAGSLTNILGSSSFTQNTPPTTVSTLSVTNYYKMSSATNQHELGFVLQDGMIEEASTPATNQFQILTQNEGKYGQYTVEPLQDQTVEQNKTIYQYPTPVGAVPLWYDVGTAWATVPFNTQTSTIKLHGMVFYEHEFVPALTYI